MVRETSIAAYREIEAKGLLSKRRFQLYKVLFVNGPMTANECMHVLNRGQPAALWDMNVHARFTELRQLGVAKEVGTTRCSLTGKEVICWDVTSKVPTSKALPKDPTKKGQTVESLRAEIKSLQDSVAAWRRLAMKLLNEIDG